MSTTECVSVTAPGRERGGSINWPTVWYWQYAKQDMQEVGGGQHRGAVKVTVLVFLSTIQSLAHWPLTAAGYLMHRCVCLKMRIPLVSLRGKWRPLSQRTPGTGGKGLGKFVRVLDHGTPAMSTRSRVPHLLLSRRSNRDLSQTINRRLSFRPFICALFLSPVCMEESHNKPFDSLMTGSWGEVGSGTWRNLKEGSLLKKKSLIRNCVLLTHEIFLVLPK